MKVKNTLFFAAIILFSTLFIQCSEDEDESVISKGSLAIKVTDAPSDDATVQGTFITVSEVKVDGEPVEGFSKQTIEISAYQQGDAKLLINEDVEAKSYSSISLVLDFETDEAGNSPGCYVLTDDNTKHDLRAESQSESEMTFTSDFEVESQTQSTWVIDFDLRKAVTREEDSSTDTEYNFVTSSEMQNAIRIVKEENSGEIKGNVSGSFTTGDELYVYAYHKGDFDASSETQAHGTSDVLFANAVTSARVEDDGSYTLAFLQEGDYEIHVASYEQENDEKSEYKALLQVNSIVSGILLNNVSVSSETTVEVDINVLGLI